MKGQQMDIYSTYLRNKGDTGGGAYPCSPIDSFIYQWIRSMPQQTPHACSALLTYSGFSEPSSGHEYPPIASARLIMTNTIFLKTATGFSKNWIIIQ